GVELSRRPRPPAPRAAASFAVQGFSAARSGGLVRPSQEIAEGTPAVWPRSRAARRGARPSPEPATSPPQQSQRGGDRPEPEVVRSRGGRLDGWAGDGRRRARLGGTGVHGPLLQALVNG